MLDYIKYVLKTEENELKEQDLVSFKVILELPIEVRNLKRAGLVVENIGSAACNFNTAPKSKLQSSTCCRKVSALCSRQINGLRIFLIQNMGVTREIPAQPSLQ